MRLSMSIEDDARQNRKYTPGEDSLRSSGDSAKRRTIMGRKLRIMTVEKGLLRETKVVQKMMDALVECRVSPDRYHGILFSKLMQFPLVLSG